MLVKSMLRTNPKIPATGVVAQDQVNEVTDHQIDDLN